LGFRVGWSNECLGGQQMVVLYTYPVRLSGAYNKGGKKERKDSK
jgi:hypothetical protein